MEELLKLRGKRVLVLGIGGGGDVATASLIHFWLQLLKAKPTIGGVVWERFPIDPIPGPIALNELEPLRQVDVGLGWATGETRALRGCGVFKPQLAQVADLLNEEALAIDLWPGPMRLIESLHTFVKSRFEAILGVDVGGDVLATGLEKDLWSPLADQVMLACLAKLEMKGFKTILAVHGLGVDGELKVQRLAKRISSVASRGGYLGAIGMGKEGAEVLEKVVKQVKTESSVLPLEAFKGSYGYKSLRAATRGVRLTIINAITFFLDPLKLYKASPMAKALANAKDLREANEKLHELGVYTELDLEEDLYRVYLEKGEVSREDIIKVKEEGVGNLRRNKVNS